MKRNSKKKAKKNGWRKKVDENLKRGYKWFACLSYNLFKNKSLPSWTHKDNNIQNTIQSDSQRLNENEHKNTLQMARMSGSCLLIEVNFMFENYKTMLLCAWIRWLVSFNIVTSNQMYAVEEPETHRIAKCRWMWQMRMAAHQTDFIGPEQYINMQIDNLHIFDLIRPTRLDPKLIARSNSCAYVPILA